MTDFDRRYCRAQTSRGFTCNRVVHENVQTDVGPIGLCKLHRGVLGNNEGITLRDGSCIVNMPIRGYVWFKESGVGPAKELADAR